MREYKVQTVRRCSNLWRTSILRPPSVGRSWQAIRCLEVPTYLQAPLPRARGLSSFTSTKNTNLRQAEAKMTAWLVPSGTSWRARDRYVKIWINLRMPIRSCRSRKPTSTISLLIFLASPNSKCVKRAQIKESNLTRLKWILFSRNIAVLSKCQTLRWRRMVISKNRIQVTVLPSRKKFKSHSIREQLDFNWLMRRDSSMKRSS